MDSINIRISYRDTDKMGVVYHANYLVFFEMGRTELLRKLGYSYDKMEQKGMFFPVVNAQCNFHSPAKYDDVITVETRIIELKNVTITFGYKIKLDGKLLVSGSTKHPMVNKNFKPARIPQNLKELLLPHLEPNEK